MIARERTLSTASVAAAIASATHRIAPVWPLKHFVAVNPFLGFADRPFAETCALLRRVGRIEILMPRAFYASALDAGEIADDDLRAAIDAAPSGWNIPRNALDVRDEVRRTPRSIASHPAHVATVADTLDALAGGNRMASGVGFMVDEISKWCAAYFDDGASSWRLPTRGLRPYRAWRSSMRDDRNPEVMGVRGFRAIVAALPEDPVATIHTVLERLGIPDRACADYLFRALLDIGGWASYARYVTWQAALAGHSDSTLVELLAIRIAWGYTLFAQRTDAAFVTAWRAAMDEAAVIPLDDRLGEDADLCLRLVLQDAYEHAYRRRLIARIAPSAAEPAQPERPLLQAAFCIDVRSEIFRRALERESPAVATLGFAGFFGYPIEYVQIGHERGGAQCPVLMPPAFTVCEVVGGTTPDDERAIFQLRRLRRRVAKTWKSFKGSAVSSFIFVEAIGLSYAVKLLSDSFGITRTVADPNTDGLDRSAIGKLEPRIEPALVGGRETGFTISQKLAMAEAALRGMSLTTGFGRIVMMVGHGSTTVNNPHATGLDCGACGGHTGEANARVSAMILNDPDVRTELRERGITIPDDTWFVGALHDTTTDAITLYTREMPPVSHRDALARARTWLASASSTARRERAAQLGLASAKDVASAILARSRDWANVRPEWGLAGNAAFLAAPRALTRGIDLGGRVFLHEYDHRRDDGYGVLASILTAPLVVASWINLQYYASTVNNRVFGAGNKTLHNVTGLIGVLEGNAGDLRTGLPWQSLHDGDRYVHEPRRLTVLVAAPRTAIDAVLAEHASVGDLVEHRWLTLFAIDDDGRVWERQAPGSGWKPVV